MTVNGVVAVGSGRFPMQPPRFAQVRSGRRGCPRRGWRRCWWVVVVRREGGRAARASWSAAPQVTGGHDARQQFAERPEVLLDSLVIDLHGRERSRGARLPELLVRVRR